MRQFLGKLQTSKDFWFVFITSVFFFLLRLPSFFEPYWYGDEGIYEVLGFGIRHGRLLYRDIWDNKPPLLYLIYALFNGDQMPVRIASFIVGLLAVVIFFFLCKTLFVKKNVQYLATVIFALLLGLPFLEGNIANAENFMILPSVVSALLIFYAVSKNYKEQKKFFFFGIAGLLLGISFLVKIVAVFDVAAFWFFVIVVFFQLENIVKFLKQAFVFSIVFITTFITPLLITGIFFASQKALHIFLQSAFFSNVGYVNYGNQLLIPQGLLIAKLLLLALICLFLLWRKRVFSLPQLFIYSWLSFSVFSAFFSQRPYTHYLLVLIASFTLFLGLVLEEQKQKVLHIVIFVIVLGVLAKNFWFYDKTIPYYENFVGYITNTKTTEAYLRFFDKSTPRDYDVAAYLQTVNKKHDPIFIWGNSAQVYKLTNALPPGKYTVAYHITTNEETLKETQTALIQTMPKYVIILQNAEDMPYRLRHYKMNITFDNAIIYERTY